MAAIPVTIDGVLCDKYGRTLQVVKLVGDLVRTDVSVGGGPIIPPEGGGDGKPPGIWGGGNEPFPTPPIVIPPQKPGDPPLVIWGGGNEPFPTPPIQLPGQPTPPPGGDRQKLVEWKTAWTPDTGWIVVGIPQVPHPAPSKK